MNLKKYIVFITFILIIVSLLFFNKTSLKDKNYILKINEEKITTQEFLTYLFQQKKVFEATGDIDIWDTDFDGISAIEVAKQNALSSIKLVKTAVLNAEKLGIFLTKDEENSIIEEAKALLHDVNFSLDANLSLKTAIKITKENKIEEKVFNYITDNFELSDKDFELYFENYLNTNKESISNIKANIVIVKKSLENSKDVINKVYSNLKNGNDFSSIEKNFKNINVFQNIILNEMHFEEDIKNQIYSLNNGELSNILESDMNYYIFNILESDINNLDDLKEKVKNEYILNKKQEIYKKQTDVWTKEVEIVKNNEVWEKITVNSLFK